MPKCTIDGREVEFKAGENLIEVARKVGIEIPYFCYHPGLSIVAQCRMCAVEIEKMPKLQTACSTPAGDGMVVKTRSERAKQNQKAIMEFLLINHPLDCPVCDKAGECDLQDFSYKYGDSYMRYMEERRTYVDLDMGPVIKKNMNRCIHCTRCIRFGTEVAGIHEMVAVKRGNNTEITTIDGRPLETDYAGNYADICPTGSLTLKDFRFKKRSWFLKKTATICEGCSRGCNMELQHEANMVYRSIPRTNMDVNQYWMCDEGRFNYRHLQDPSRVTKPTKSGSFVDWSAALSEARAVTQGKKTAVFVGTDLTQEEISMVIQFAQKSLPNSTVVHFGTPGVNSAADDAALDKILKRKSKTANLHGAEKLGLKGSNTATGYQAAVVFSGGRSNVAALMKDVKVPAVGVGVFTDETKGGFSVILPGAGFSEKDGTIVNFNGVEQKLKRAVLPPGQSKATSEILMMWSNQSGAQASATAGARV
ncbi:MAG: (2Fe-2S)-binding protein [Bdellovibrionales bacterium]|nr:(2Fe-2S)-binding protein [Bdellovibrionales bacterium]